MITLYSGTPGSGKSWHAVERVITLLSRGRYVIANFPIKFTEKQIKKGMDKLFYYYPNEKITIDTLIEFAIDNGFIEKGKESQCLVVIDEAGGRFNCRDFKDSQRKEWIDFFSQHRKLAYDFIMVAQNDRMLDRQIRGYLEYEKKHRKINNFGPFTFLPFTVFVAVEYWYAIKQRVGSEFMIFKKKIANQYDSMALFSGFTLSDELIKRIEQRKTGIDKEQAPEGLDVNINAIFADEKE